MNVNEMKAKRLLDLDPEVARQGAFLVKDVLLKIENLRQVQALLKTPMANEDPDEEELVHRFMNLVAILTNLGSSSTALYLSVSELLAFCLKSKMLVSFTIEEDVPGVNIDEEKTNETDLN